MNTTTASDSELRRLQDTCPAVYTYWRHYKGNVYIVVGACIDEATLKPCVLYRREDVPHGPIFCRPLESWQESIRVGEMDLPRFSEDQP